MHRYTQSEFESFGTDFNYRFPSWKGEVKEDTCEADYSGGCNTLYSKLVSSKVVDAIKGQSR